MTMPQIRALREMVVIRPDPKNARSGNIILPESSQDEPERGEVISVGPGWYDEKGTFHPTELTPGKRVLFPRYRGYPVEVLNEGYLIMREKDVLGEEVELPEDPPHLDEETLLNPHPVPGS